jgi:hypothetical protein
LNLKRVPDRLRRPLTVAIVCAVSQVKTPIDMETIISIPCGYCCHVKFDFSHRRVRVIQKIHIILEYAEHDRKLRILSIVLGTPPRPISNKTHEQQPYPLQPALQVVG